MIVVLWTGFPSAFEAIFSTLFIPLSLAALGIVLRGAGSRSSTPPGGRAAGALAEALFGLASVLTPFFMGTVVGAIAGGRVPVGNAAGDPVTSWLNPLSLVDRRALRRDERLPGRGVPRQRRPARRRARPRALLRNARARRRRSSPERSRRSASSRCTATRGSSSTASTPTALPLVILSLVCGGACSCCSTAAPGAGAARWRSARVAAVIWGWGVAQHPYLLPQTLTISAAAAPSSTLTSVLIVFGVAAVVVPSLALLYTLVQRNVVEETSKPS